MRSPVPNDQYHVVKFDDPSEAAAFVAALSRFLSSPRGTTETAASGVIEVWAPSAKTAEVEELYLSDGALSAAIAGFGQVPLAGVRRGDALSSDCGLMIGGDRPPAWGVDEATRHLTSD
jgi:hypothetical protein